MRNKPKFSKRVILKAVQRELKETAVCKLVNSFLCAMDSMKSKNEIKIYKFGVKILKTY